MDGLKFYLTMLTLMLDQDESGAPRKRRGRHSRRPRARRNVLTNRPIRPMKSLRGGQTLRRKSRSGAPQH